MKPLLLFLLYAGLLLGCVYLHGQGCGCTNCPQFMPDNFQGNFTIQVDGAANPTLGQNGQGVCGVVLNFDHEYVGDLTITLTSPGGQTVTLVGPIGLFGSTDFSSWNVTFLPCNEAVTPDPGFNNVWSNNQMWGMFGNFAGSYYPAIGCLENFNSGPVDGTWTLTVVDGQQNDVGNFYDYEIIFCDPAGITCFSCDADAGSLPQPDVVACQGDQSLNLTLPPAYSINNPAPDPALYAYTYVVGGAGGVLVAVLPDPDLSTFDAGVYTVCGLSYLIADAADLPVPNGTLTVQQLRNQLNSTTPPFCGDVGTECVGIVINDTPDDVVEYASRCAPECVTFFGLTYCQTGTYVRNLLQNGCPYTATLFLTINQPKTVFLNETICAGGCSVNPTFPTACSTGTYTETLKTVADCDSTVVLNLNVLDVHAQIQPPPVLGCGQNTAQLSGLGSTAGQGATYLWTAGNGGSIIGSPSGITVTIGSPGSYSLRVCRTFGGATCCDTAMVDVVANNSPPAASAGIAGPASLCFNQTATYTAVAVAGATGYLWQVPPGVVLVSGQGTATIQVQWSAGSGGVVCVSAENGCGVGPSQCLAVALNTLPAQVVPVGNTQVCAGTDLLYSVPTQNPGTQYSWSVSAPSYIASGQGTNQVIIGWSGVLPNAVCLTLSNGCGASAPACLPVQILETPATPVIAGNAAVCAGNLETYHVAATTGVSIFNWTVSGGQIIGGNGTDSIQVAWDSGISAGSVCLNALNACGVSPPACLLVDILPALPPYSVSGDTFACVGLPTQYLLQGGQGASGYIWTLPPGCSIIAGQGNDTLLVNWISGTGGNVCVSPISSCGAGTPRCVSVQLSTQPTAMAGSDQSVCALFTQLNAAVDTLGSGFWVVGGGGSLSFENAASPTSGVTASSVGVYSLVWTQANAHCVDRDTVEVQFNETPVAGPLARICDAANAHYTVSFPVIGGTQPYGINNGAISGSFFISSPIPSQQPYSFQITDVNGCTSPIYTGSYDCNCLSDAGYMSQQVKTACVGQTIKSEPLGGIVTDGNDAVWFYLHDNAGNLLGTIYAINQSGQFSYQPGMVSGATYYISRVVGNGDFMGGINLSDPCLSVSQGQPVIFYAIPVPDAGPDQQICVGPAILNGNGGIGFWGLAGSPAGSNAVVLNPQSSVTGLSVDIPGVYLLSFEVNDNGCIGFDNVQVELLPSPTISGISAICDAASEYYQVGFEVSGGSSPYWVNQVPLSGANFLSDAVVSGDAYVFLVSDDNNCVTTVSGINSCDCASDAGAVSGALVLVCGGDTATVEVLTPAQADANDGLGYVLHTGSGSSLGAVIDQSSTGKFTFQPGMTYGFTYYMSQVVGNTPSGQLDFGDPCLSVSIGQPVVFYPIPIALAGADQRVCGLSTQLSGTGTGSWSSLSGGSVVYPPDDPGGAVTAMDSGAALFEWTVKENGCYGRDTVVVEFLALPVGFNLATECDPTNESFVVSFSIQGGAAPYQVGGDLLTGNYFEGQPLPNGSSYSYQISDANGCNSAPVMGGYSCACGTDAGTMPQQVLTACSGGVVQVVGSSNEILDPNDVAVYVLHDGQGALLGQVFATNTTGLFGFQSGMQYGTTYYVSLVAGNDLGGSPDPADPCFSVSVGQPVRFISTPMPDVGLDTAVCGQTYALTVQSDGLGGNWQWVSGPLGSFFTTPGQASTAVTVQNFGDYAFRWVSDDNGCLGADTLHIRFQPLPQVATLGEVCNDTYTAYALEFTCGSGLPPYSVAGLSGSFNGGVFTSGFLADGSAYSFTVTDANGCASPAVSGTHDCACITFAGTLVTTPALFCAGEAATAVWNNNPTLDGDDGVQFILHSTPGGSLGTVYAVADVPSFALTPPLQPNVTYYIAAVAGSKIAGGIDVSDPCLDISLGTPVRWKPVPEVVFGGDATICAGGSATLSLQATGVFPITVLYAGTGASPFVVSLPNDQPIQLTVSPAVSTTYRLIDATDGVAPLCRVDLADSVVVAVNPPVFAGISGDPAHVCAGITQALDLDSLLVGGMAGGSWSQAGGPPFVPGVLNGQTGILQLGNQEVGSYALQYTLQGLPPCPSSIATVAVEVHPTPTAAAGPDQTLTCLEETLTLGAAVGEPGVTYAWYASGQVQGLAAELSVNTPAVYIQEAISLEGCTDRDTVVVVEDRSYPLASGFSVQDVRCFGDKDGKIVVEGVQSNNPPVLFALSGGSFGESSEFYPLEPGKYTVVLQAANGCEWESDTLIVGQPPQMVAALGSELVVDLGEEAVVQALVNLPGRVDTVLWFPLLDTLHAAELVQVFTPLENQVLAVRILDTNGCATNARVLVVVKNNLDVYVPNIFHPEQGYNNLIGVFGGRQVSLVESFMVYDRWGNLVHEVTDFPADGQSAGWDGRYRGRPLPPGVYVYQAVVRFINGRRRVFSGDITLIR